MKNKIIVKIGLLACILLGVTGITNVCAKLDQEGQTKTSQQQTSNQLPLLSGMGSPQASQTQSSQPSATLASPVQVVPLTSQSSQQSYAVTLKVNGEGTHEREQSFTNALNQVLINSSNNQNIGALPIIKNALSSPGNYVQRYTYVSRNVAAGQQFLFLQIQFDQIAINQLLKQALKPSQAIETPNEKQILLWMVKDAYGNKTIENEKNSGIVVQSLKKNNLSIVFPTLDLADISSIKADDICRFDADKIKAASQRYGVSDIVAGCIKQPIIIGNQWTGQWLLIHDGKVNSFNFSGNTADDMLVQVIPTLVSSVVDTSKQQAHEEKVTLRVTNVKGLDQYNEIARYLRAFDKVSQVDLTKINATEIELSVSVIGGLPSLLVSLGAQGRLVRNTEAVISSSGVDLDYKWVPASNEQPQTVGTKPLP